MKPLKATITEIILRTVGAVPFLFPEWLKRHADVFSSFEQHEPTENQKKWDAVQTCGLLQGNFRWKAVSVVLEITADDLYKIHAWFRRKAPLGQYNADRDAWGFDTQYVHEDSYRNLGWININSEKSILGLASIEIAGSPCKSCYVTIQKLANGFSYLSLYFFLDEKIAETVVKMDVGHLERYQQFSSLNPFSKNCRIIEFVEKYHAVERTAKKHISAICEDVRRTSRNILGLWKLQKSEDDLVLVADIYRDCNQGYFQNTTEAEDSYLHYAVFKRGYGFAANRYGDDIELIYMTEDLGLDGVCIKSRKREELGKIQNFLECGLAIYDSHLFLSMLISTMRKFGKIARYSNEAVLNVRDNVKDCYQNLFDADLMLLRLRENVAAISKSIKRVCAEPYQEHAKESCEYQLEQLREFRKAINNKKRISHDAVQLESLRFHKKYAIWIGVFVLAQIILAGFSVNLQTAHANWSKLADLAKSIVPF